MTRRTAIGIVAGTLLVMLIIGIMFICAKGAATPGGNLYEPQHTIGVEEEDCDKEDKAKGEWWE